MPVGVADRGDIDCTPSSGVNINNGKIVRINFRDIPGLSYEMGYERQRVEAIIVDGSGNVLSSLGGGGGGLPPNSIDIADNASVLATISTQELIFDIVAQTGTLGGAAIAGLVATTQFSISASISTAGAGIIYIYYRLNAAANWRLYEPVPLSFNLPVNKTIVPTRRQYRIFYTATTNTTGLDLQVILFSTPK